MMICCICKKKEVPNSGTFFKIPSDERRRSQWSAICRMQFKKFDRICKDHFVSSHIMKGTKRLDLMPCAVPCLRLFPEASTTPVINTVAKTAPVKVKDICPQDFLDISMGDPLFLPETTTPKFLPETTTPKYVDGQTQTESRNIQGEIDEELAMNEKLQADIKELKSKLAEKNNAMSYMKTIFTEGQIKQLTSPGKVRWGRNDISHAIRLHSSGPKTYEYLYKKGFPLPPVPTLEFWCRKFVVNVGFQTTSVGFMKHCTDFANEDKICVLAFGKMKVVEENENDSVGDTKINSAAYVQVVMAQGLWKPWKRPVFFDFDCQMKKQVVSSIIEKLNQSGFLVVALVGDTTPTNLKLWRELEVTKDKPWFPNPTNPEEKVFTFVDVPHLLELIRHHFLNTGLLWRNELLTSRTIADGMKHTSKIDSRITFKLTDKHISDKGVGGQKLAAQLFSKTTVDALRQCYTAGINVYKATETANLFQLVKDWFEIHNSSTDTFATPGKEPFGISLADHQRSTLSRMNKLMSSPIIPSKTTLEHFQEGVIMTNTALEMLLDYIKLKFSMTYIFTSQLNQHELKHLFGAIRCKGELDDKITPKEFKIRLRKYILAQNMIHFYGTGNATSDTINSSSSTNTRTSEENVYNQNEMDVIDEDGEHENELIHEIDADCEDRNGNVESDNTESPNSTKSLGTRIHVSNKKSTEEMDVDNNHEVLHEIVADRDPAVLDELDTANFDDVGTFVEDALNYISG